jgi:L-rhamnose-H+ transport protein
VDANPFGGLIYHWIGGLAAASFYLPFKRVKGWAWETYWLVAGVFSWIAAPIVLALILVPDLWSVLSSSPGRTLSLVYFWGAMWGIGGLTFGLSMRYLGIALGYALALGLCTAFGTLVPPLFSGELARVTHDRSLQIVVLGVGVCLVGIVFSGLAGVSKERELTREHKEGTIAEFNFVKGLVVATFAGVMSACFAYGLAAGKPIANSAAAQLAAGGRSGLWQNLPVLVVVLLGGFTTNFIWCVILNARNRTAHQYTRAEANASLGANYLLSAAAGVIWYLQFFFYSMGQTKMGKYEFSSWTLHMASIILFSTLWGIMLHEWAGTSRRTRVLVALGILTLILSTVVVGYGNYIGAQSAAH